jgi:hypothetical protein
VEDVAAAATAVAQFVEAPQFAAGPSRIEAERSFDAARSWAALTQGVAIMPPPATPPTNIAEAAVITAAEFIAVAPQFAAEPLRIEAERWREAAELALLTVAAAADVVADTQPLGRRASSRPQLRQLHSRKTARRRGIANDDACGSHASTLLSENQFRRAHRSSASTLQRRPPISGCP